MLFGNSSSSVCDSSHELSPTKTRHHDKFVVQGVKKKLLGLPATISLNLAVTMDTSEMKTQGDSDVHKKLFQGLGNLGDSTLQGRSAYSHHGTSPYFCAKKRSRKIYVTEAVGIITKLYQQTQWCVGMAMVPNKEGKLRICVDLKRLNSVTLFVDSRITNIQFTGN